MCFRQVVDFRDRHAIVVIRPAYYEVSHMSAGGGQMHMHGKIAAYRSSAETTLAPGAGIIFGQIRKRMTMTPPAMLCPRCRRLIGSDETICSWCGARRAATRWSPAAWRGGLPGDWWIRNIVILNVVFYLLSLLLGIIGVFPATRFECSPPLIPACFCWEQPELFPIDEFGRVWSLLSANYLHGGILHIVFNLVALRQIAPWVSQEFGASRMFIIYTAGGVGGYAISYLAGIAFTIGASAAVCALIGALLYFGRSRGGTYGGMVFREVSGWVISLFLFGLIVPGINNWGHGGGILAGIILGMLLGYQERRPERAIHHFLALLCGITTVAVLGWACLGSF